MSNKYSKQRYNPGKPEICRIPPPPWPIIPPIPPPPWPSDWPQHVHAEAYYNQWGPTNKYEFYPEQTLERLDAAGVYAATLHDATTTLDLILRVDLVTHFAKLTAVVWGATPSPNAGNSDPFDLSPWPAPGVQPVSVTAMINPESNVSTTLRWP